MLVPRRNEDPAARLVRRALTAVAFVLVLAASSPVLAVSLIVSKNKSCPAEPAVRTTKGEG